jgi:hypothetical protein
VRRVLSAWKGLLLGVIVAAVLVYSGMLVWFHTAKPRLSRNFAAEFNARFASVPAGERAQTAYFAAFEQMPEPPEDLRSDGFTGLRPGDPLWPVLLEFLRQVGPGLKQVRRAAAMPVLGMELSDGRARGWSLTAAARAVEPDPPSANPEMVGVLLPQLGVFRQLSREFVADALAASEAGESARATADLKAVIGIARHAREYPILINDLVSVAILHLEISRLELIVERYPGLLSDEQLRELSGELAEFPLGPDAVRYAGERWMVEDLVQRIYTDNGNGDGRLCAAGLRVLSSLQGTGTSPSRPGFSVPEWFFGPVIAFASPGRKELLAEHRRVMDLADAAKRVPRWEPGQGASGELNALINNPAWSSRHLVLSIMLPAFSKATESAEQITQVRDGALAVVALERFRMAQGRYPQGLNELVPQYLAAVPLDRLDGRPLRYRNVDGKPVLYSIGTDLDDDGGTPPLSGNLDAWRFRPQPPAGPDGDFVLWPDPDNVPSPPKVPAAK